MPKIADELWAWRHELRLTQAQAAQLLQVGLSTYWRWEKGRTLPEYRDMQALRARFEETRRQGLYIHATRGKL